MTKWVYDPESEDNKDFEKFGNRGKGFQSEDFEPSRRVERKKLGKRKRGKDEDDYEDD